jgi:PleD family two-component response regulator
MRRNSLEIRRLSCRNLLCDHHPPEAALGASARKEARVGNILVCDDERSICELLDIALRRDGHKVETVTGGEAAKRKIDSASST